MIATPAACDVDPTQQMQTDELDFDLPPELIAQAPPPDRASSRLMHYRMADGSVEHRHFSDLPSLLRTGDLLVLNDARVVPARFTLRKDTGGAVEGLFLDEPEPGTWRVLLKNLGPVKPGMVLTFPQEPAVNVRLIGKLQEGDCHLSVDQGPALALLSRVGRMPLPPYVRRGKQTDPRDDVDRERYQTVFARAPGSVAAPTAGLHFTDAIFRELDERQVQRAFVTLHVGMGTFKPVTAATLAAHAMHAEAYSISAEAADALNRAKRDGRRIIAVGTTATRVLESQPADRPFTETSAQTRIFIYPPYAWKHVAGLITNFHLPRSTLIALVAAKVGLAKQRRLYQIAIAERYRFFSYGDATFIE